MFRYLLALVLLSTVACSGGGHSSDQKETGGIAVSLQWPPSISGEVHTSAFGLPSSVTALNFSITFYGDDFSPESHTVIVDRDLLGVEQTTVDGSLLLAPDPDGPKVTFDVVAGLNRGIFIAGDALVDGQELPVVFAGFSAFDVDLINGASVTVNLRDDADRPQPPTFEVLGADNPVVGASLLLSAQGRIGADFTFPVDITNITSSDLLVAEVDSLSLTTVNLLAAGPVTLTVDLATGDQVVLNLDVTLEAPVVSLSGQWDVLETLESGGCPGDPLTDSYSINITQTGSTFSVELPSLDVIVGDITGSDFSWDQSYPEDGGTTTELLNGTLSSDGLSFTATSSWSWTDGINPSNDCSGTSSFSGAKVTIL